MCISKRLKQVLEVKNMTITEFSNVTGISYRSAMNYLNEGRDPNVDALVKIHKGLKISITWLLTGNGAMFQAATQENNISAQEEKLIADYRTMPDNLKEAFAISFKEISDKL
ncbi:MULTISPECIES: helix-turn-helix domain-containing protein [Pasteurellaceae]|uniref:helix-turn-helix domain-containing protein n=1 Tax=Pasteurellaceae TaxID=712 RepID=UPI003565B9BB